MEIKSEIQRMIDEFDAGCYYYRSPDEEVVLEINNSYDKNYLRFEGFIDGQRYYFVPNCNNERMDLFYTNGVHRFEGCASCATDELIEKVQNIIIESKNYIEENGFIEKCFFERLNHEIRFAEHRLESKFENLDEILEMIHKMKNEKAELFWV